MAPVLNTFDASFANDGSPWLSLNVHYLLPLLLCLFALGLCMWAIRKYVLVFVSSFAVLTVAITASTVNVFHASFANDGSLWLSVKVHHLLLLLLCLFALGLCMWAVRKHVLLFMSSFAVLTVAIAASTVNLKKPPNGAFVSPRLYTLNVSEFNISQRVWHTSWEDPAHRAAKILAVSYVKLDKDEATRKFLTSCRESARSWIGRLHTFVGFKLSDVLQEFCGWSETDALLFTPSAPMFVASTSQLQRLLQHVNEHGFETSRFQNLLDIGAGAGVVTDILSQAFEVPRGKVTAIETSKVMQFSLTYRGFNALSTLQQIPKEGRLFDVIALLNVLDRCDDPDSLLKDSLKHLSSTGVLVISTPLPFCDGFFEGKVGRKKNSRFPRTPIHIRKEATCREKKNKPSFEFAVSAFAAAVFDRHNLRVIAWSRLPYLSSGNTNYSWYYLDSAVFLLRHLPEGAPLMESTGSELADATDELVAAKLENA